MPVASRGRRRGARCAQTKTDKRTKYVCAASQVPLYTIPQLDFYEDLVDAVFRDLKLANCLFRYFLNVDLYDECRWDYMS